jgi:hypothetical protein
VQDFLDAHLEDHVGVCADPRVASCYITQNRVMINIPRALFTGRTGREPRYHVAIEELQDWTYTGERLVPVKGYPGIVWERPKSRRRPRDVDALEFLNQHGPSARTHIVR